jgi:iron transport multicopper oxidase
MYSHHSLRTETALHPLVKTPVPGKPFPGGADINLNLDIALDFATFKFTVNGAVRSSIPRNVP